MKTATTRFVEILTEEQEQGLEAIREEIASLIKEMQESLLALDKSSYAANFWTQGHASKIATAISALVQKRQDTSQKIALLQKLQEREEKRNNNEL